jgi:transposase-like protein
MLCFINSQFKGIKIKSLNNEIESLKQEIDRIKRMTKKNPHYSFSEKIQIEIAKRKNNIVAKRFM